MTGTDRESGVGTFLLVLSAPSGGGKTTIAQALRTARDDIGFSVSATTRAPRAGEVDGEDYFFLTPEEFQQRIDDGAFLEWATYGGHRYGTLTSEVDRIRDEGRRVVLDIDVQGARMVRERVAEVVSIFIIPPSAAELRARLAGRSTEAPDRVAERMALAVEEIGEALSYDYVVVNEDRTQAVDEVARIIDAEARRTHRIPGLPEQIAEIRTALAEEVRSLRP